MTAPQSSLVIPLQRGEMVALLRLAMGAWAYRFSRLSPPPRPALSFSTQPAPRLLRNRLPGTCALPKLTHSTLAILFTRALFPGGDGETQCSKIDSGKAPDRSSLRSQGVTPHCGSTPRVSSNGLSTSDTKLAEPSSSGTVRFHLSLKQWLHVQPPPFREAKD